jgi:hypothetical protein
MVTTFAAYAGDRRRPVPTLQAYVLDVGAGGLGDPQPVQREQQGASASPFDLHTVYTRSPFGR